MEELQVKANDIPFGIMTWWNEHREASQYQVKLSYKEINSPLDYQKLTIVTIDRNTFYYTFTGLAIGYYKIEVCAENRAGETIASGTVEREVRLLAYHTNPHYGWSL